MQSPKITVSERLSRKEIKLKLPTAKRKNVDMSILVGTGHRELLVKYEQTGVGDKRHWCRGEKQGIGSVTYRWIIQSYYLTPINESFLSYLKNMKSNSR